MSEYIEREAVTTLFARACSECKEACEEFDGFYADCNQCLLHGVKEKLATIPAADVRPVIYCKECQHRPAKEYGRIKAPKDADGYTDYKCPFVCEDPWYNRMPADDDYCSCGEKREES